MGIIKHTSSVLKSSLKLPLNVRCVPLVDGLVQGWNQSVALSECPEHLLLQMAVVW